MNMGEVTFDQRALLRQHATITVRVTSPAHHRAMVWVGLHLIRIAAWCIGVGSLVIEDGSP